jgi:FkbM family methyltransferase
MVMNSPFDNVYKFQACLGRTPGWVKMEVADPSNYGTNEVVPGMGTVPMFTIDQFDLDALDFVQIDAEGYEANILAGGEKTIRKYKPVIVAERNVNHSDTEAFIASIGYHEVDSSKADRIYVPV